MELKSLTPLAEFTDVIYTRCATELTPIEGLRWWLELRPPVTKDDGTGIIHIKGVVHDVGLGPRIIEIRCLMDAVTEGHGAGQTEMAIVADHHIARFISAVRHG